MRRGDETWIANFSLLEELAAPRKPRRCTAPKSRSRRFSPCRSRWRSCGNRGASQPAAIVGHSVGEIAAACVAGCFQLEEGARIIVLRAQFMDGCARGEGTMLAVGLGEEEARALIARHDRTVTIAAFNGPRSLTLAGPRHFARSDARRTRAAGRLRAHSCASIIRSITR